MPRRELGRPDFLDAVGRVVLRPYIRDLKWRRDESPLQVLAEDPRSVAHVGLGIGEVGRGAFPAPGVERHDLHEAGGTDIGFSIGHKAAFLAHQAINPGLIQILPIGMRHDLVGMRGREAQFVVVLLFSAVCRADRAVNDLITLRNFSGGQ